MPGFSITDQSQMLTMERGSKIPPKMWIPFMDGPLVELFYELCFLRVSLPFSMGALIPLWFASAFEEKEGEVEVCGCGRRNSV